MTAFPKSWRIVPLNTVCDAIIDCVNKTAPTVEYPTPYRMIRTTNVKGGRILLEGAKFVEEGVFRKWTRRTALRAKDIVLTREAPLGEVGMVRTSDPLFLGQRTMVYRSNGFDLDQVFLYYSFLSQSLQSQIHALGSGSTVEHLRVPHAESLKIPLPNIQSQKKIAALLSAYDDLIENNTRRISLLEKVAEEIYREWFVRLRFPGHEKTKSVKGVPEGWKSTLVKDAFEICGGGTPSTDISSYWKDGDINWYSPTDLTANKSLFAFASRQKITSTGLRESAARLFPAYSVMMTSRATIGELCINTTPACTNQGFIVCLPNSDLSLFYLYFWLKFNKNNFIQLANGSTFLEITKGRFKNIDILIPEKAISRQFVDFQKPIFKKIETLLIMNQILRKSRDSLLPRLMSGKIDLEPLDIQFPPSMREESLPEPKAMAHA